MLFPEDPDKRPNLWHSLAEKLVREPIFCLVAHGEQCDVSTARLLNEAAADELMKRFRAASLSRISSSRGAAISPHFAATLDGDCARIVELITVPEVGALEVNERQLRDDVETAVINLLYGARNIRSVIVPLRLSPWVMTDADVQDMGAGMLFTKRGDGGTASKPTTGA